LNPSCIVSLWLLQRRVTWALPYQLPSFDRILLDGKQCLLLQSWRLTGE